MGKNLIYAGIFHDLADLAQCTVLMNGSEEMLGGFCCDER
jgi:hypothetical protein